MAAKFKCLKCGSTWATRPGMVTCIQCGNLYVKWVNYDKFKLGDKYK